MIFPCLVALSPILPPIETPLGISETPIELICARMISNVFLSTAFQVYVRGGSEGSTLRERTPRLRPPGQHENVSLHARLPLLIHKKRNFLVLVCQGRGSQNVSMIRKHGDEGGRSILKTNLAMCPDDGAEELPGAGTSVNPEHAQNLKET